MGEHYSMMTTMQSGVKHCSLRKLGTNANAASKRGGVIAAIVCPWISICMPRTHGMLISALGVSIMSAAAKNDASDVKESLVRAAADADPSARVHQSIESRRTSCPHRNIAVGMLSLSLSLNNEPTFHRSVRHMGVYSKPLANCRV